MKKIFAALIIVTSVITAQGQKPIELSGILSLDNSPKLVQANPANQTSAKINGAAKSPLMAGALSFFVPGSGEIYTGNYFKAVIFVAVEAAAITTAIIYDNKGNDQTDFFENYAEENWSPAQYARWTQDNLNSLNGGLDPADFNVFKDENRTIVNWSELNRLESSIGAWYSHRLAPYQDQQYYEMIGKYPQFNPGWNDFNVNSTYQYGDPLTENFLHYSSLRGEANDFYTVAKTFVNILVVNHLLSAIDAAWSASRYNKKIEMDLSMKSMHIGYAKDYYPELNIKYNF